MSVRRDDLPVLPFASMAKWTAWLRKNHMPAQGLWLKFAKKDSGVQSVTYEQARDGAIMFGWIDGLKQAFDDTHYLIRFTPRRKKSRWSKINRKIAEDLVARKTMHASGIAEVEAAKADGRWQAAYASQSTAQVPPDLRKALAKTPKAKSFFATISSANRYAVLYRIHDAKLPETRAARIEKFVGMLARGEVIYRGR